MSLKQINRLIGTGPPSKRKKDDFYATPSYVTMELLKRESFIGEIWEPACGDGAISKVLKENRFDPSMIYSTDLIDRGYGDAHFDFLLSNRQTDNIITNPPFNLGTKFTLHALNLASSKVAIFNKITFLEGKERRDKLFSLHMLKRVYVFSERVGFGQKEGKGGMLAFAWFVFDKKFRGDPIIKFI